MALHGWPSQSIKRPKDGYETSQDETKTPKAERTLDALLYEWIAVALVYYHHLPLSGTP